MKLRSYVLLLAVLLTSFGIKAQTFTNIALNTPSLVSGTANQVGAVYKYANAATGIDAYIQIFKTSNTGTNFVGLYAFDNAASVNNPGGYDYAFQPVTSCSNTNSNGLWTAGGCGQGYVKITSTSSQNYLVHFRMYFKKAGTQTDTALNFRAAFIDIDGFGSGTEAEQNAFMPGIAYAIASPTTLTITQRADGLYNAEGQPANVGGIQLTSTTAVSQVTYRNRTYVDFGIGMNTHNGNNYGGCYDAVAGGRLASVSFATQPSGCNTITPTIVTLSGTVWDDADGSANGTFTNIKTGTEAGTAGGGLYVYVLDSASGTVLGKSAVAANGTWSVDSLPKNMPVKLVLSSLNVAEGVTNGAPTGVLNSGWTAESPLLRPAFRPTANTGSLDFGIEQIPVGANYTAPSQLNPGGTTTVAVPTASFTGTDAEDGTYTTGLSGRKVTLYAGSNADVYYNGTLISTSLTVTSFNPALVALDPTGPTPTTAVALTSSFNYSVFDNADEPSLPKTITLPFDAPVIISGNVWDDANGDAAKAATEAFTNAGGLYVVLTNSTGNVIAVSAVNATTGAYQFTQAAANTTYKLVLSTTSPNIGSTLTTATLPNPANGAWVNTGVNLGGVASTSNKSGIISVTTTTANLVNQNFGIEQIPAGANYTATSQTNPGGTTTVPVPTAAFSGTDPEDGTYTTGLNGRTVTLSPGTNANLYYNGTLITSSITISNFNPALLALDPTGPNPTSQVAVTSSFTYSVYDNAGQPSPAKTITVPFDAPLIISGNVWDDANGDAIKAGAEAFTNAGGLNAVITNASGSVIAVVPVNATTGAYQYTLANSGTTYKIVLTTSNPSVGSTLTNSDLPAPASGAWVNTGVNLDGVVNTGNKTGIITVTTGLVAVANQNFGIEQIPAGADYTAARQTNPGGTTTVPVPAAAFTGTDPEDGTYTAGLSGKTVTITPGTNGNLYYNGTLVTGTQTINGFNPALLTIDPTGPTPTAQVNVTATFSYSVYDAAGQPSPAKTITMPFDASLVISGNVWDDANGDAVKIAAEPYTNAGGLNAVLTSASGSVIAVVPVNATTGAYQFTGISNSTTYKVVLSTSSPAIGSLVTSATLPAPANGAWVNTGVNLDGVIVSSNKTGIITVITGTTNVANQNFGIEQIPAGANYTAASQLNPGGTTTVPVPAAAFTGIDAEDGTYTTGLSGKKVTITPGSNLNLYYNGVLVTGAQTITGFNPLLLAVDPTGATPTAQSSVASTFTYSIFDAADMPSAPATITMPFEPPVVISGNVWDDANGNAVKEASEAYTNAGGLYAVLTNASGTVLQTVAVGATTGFYQFDRAISNTSYKIIISTTNPAVGSTATSSSLPAGTYGNWVNTGVNLNGAASTTNKTGVISYTTTTSSATNLNFGIEQPPTGFSAVVVGQQNPGGTRTVPVPGAAFTGTDPEDGTYASGLSGRTVILSPGTDCNLFYNGNLITAATTITGFNPNLVTIDPTGPNPTGFDAVTSTLVYQLYDNANVVSTPKTVTLSFNSALCIKPRVYIEGSLINNGNAVAVDGRPLMRDNLRNSPFTGKNYIPKADPYEFATPFVNVVGKYTKVAPQGMYSEFGVISDSATVFGTSGQNAIVDWVFVELRNKSNSQTVAATRAALLQRDGDVVELDGQSCVAFPGVVIDSYYVSIRHRSHLGAMTKYAQSSTNLQTLVDFTVPSTPIFDKGTVGLNNFSGLGEKPNVKGTYRALWQGDFNADGKVKYDNPNDDLAIMLNETVNYPGNTDLATNFDFAYGYRQGDYDMNSKVKYDNPNDDNALLLTQVVNYTQNSDLATNYDFLIQQLP